jgi:hypothetical protein
MAKVPYRPVEVEAAAPSVPTTVRLKIEGLSPVFDDPDVFELRDVRIAEVNYPAIHEILVSSGVDQEDADVAIESFARRLETQLLAKAIAQRTKRVG